MLNAMSSHSVLASLHFGACPECSEGVKNNRVSLQCHMRGKDISELKSVLQPLLRSQTINRIRQRRANSLITNRGECKDDRERSCSNKGPPLYTNVIGKVAKPLIHEIISYRRSNDDCYNDKLNNVPRQGCHDLKYTRT